MLPVEPLPEYRVMDSWMLPVYPMPPIGHLLRQLEQAFAVAIWSTVVSSFALATATMRPVPLVLDTLRVVAVVCGLLLSPGLEKNMFQVFQAGFIEFNSIQTQCKSKQLNT
jgi:hypothetical protein